MRLDADLQTPGVPIYLLIAEYEEGTSDDVTCAYYADRAHAETAASRGNDALRTYDLALRGETMTDATLEHVIQICILRLRAVDPRPLAFQHHIPLHYSVLEISPGAILQP